MDVESNGGIGPCGCAKFVATAQPITCGWLLYNRPETRAR